MSKDTARRDIENKSYLSGEINTFLEPMMLEVVHHKPENQVSKTCNYIGTR
jgi:hypothetical protein